MSIDLRKMVAMIDTILAKETPETLGTFLARQTSPEMHNGEIPTHILVDIKDFVELMSLGDIAVQPDRPKRLDTVILEKIKVMAGKYGMNWTGRGKTE